MLIKTILLPSALSQLSQLNQNLFCNNAVGLLHDLCENCIILVDNDNITTHELFQTLRDKWPQKFRKKGQKLLTKLRQLGRFVKIAGNYPLSEKCSEISCQHCIGIAQSFSPRAILVGGSCYNCAGTQISGTPEVVDITEHTMSRFYEHRKSYSSITKANSEWTQKDFEDKVLIPIFDRAKHVKIFDRNIGHITNTKRTFPGNYRLTLEWMINIFTQFPSEKERTFEITSGIDTRSPDSAKNTEDIVCALRQFESEVNDKSGFTIKINIKKETHDNQLPHARYLITDQIGLLIDRGFDLLWGDKKMRHKSLDPQQDDRPIRDFDIKLISYSDWGNIEKSARLLENL